jgi:hypothetical protein
MKQEVTEVEVIAAHFYERDRQPGERYDCDNRHLPIVLGRDYVRIVDTQEVVIPFVAVDVEPIQMNPHPPTMMLPEKKKRGRPPGSGLGHYNKRSVGESDFAG